MTHHHVSTNCYINCMDKETEKEFERIRNLSFDEMVSEGFITLPKNLIGNQ